ncbi:MAG: ABC transporter permease, partial [Candidatus Riflebacteria bacterium]|nr:ABC transporter permease [Candidatus Riflebacteria bacterium]
MFWPVMDLIVWGSVSVWMQKTGGQIPRAVDVLLGALVLWTILYRAQLGVTVAFLEDMWSRNFVNVFVSPVRLSELLVATGILSATKALLTGLVLVPLAWGLYGCDVLSQGVTGSLALLILLGLGWALGIVTTGLILRYGHAAEALAWGIPFLIQPISAVFYPVWVLPALLPPLALALPSTHA